MQNFKFDFLEKDILGLTGVYILSSISRILHNFSMGFFSMYRGILELKYKTNTLCKNDLIAYKTCCFLTALFIETKFYFCFCNFGNKQISRNS